ncbi:DNA starvation/stationary phase protection protein Dps [Zavarzinella formosa]|uniref:DNA starvation/stationary phase protection protein Dps n=1 Tax=Zavarzinella formosa TaxID=360055 RepID=UPI0002EF94E7|nr:DNA starvation/stationary phase protection protein Dps [Zavarzinella formosa]
MSERHFFKTRIDIKSDVREKIVELLNQQLADTSDLFTQTKQAHWNVKGANFIAVHKMFDEFAGQIIEHVDEIAERTTALGGVAMGTARMAAKNSRLPEYPTDAVNSQQHLTALADRYAALAKTTREAIDKADGLGDKSTADLFTSISRDLDQALWFIEAHLQG